jgi:hypothetical protein
MPVRRQCFIILKVGLLVETGYYFSMLVNRSTLRFQSNFKERGFVGSPAGKLRPVVYKTLSLLAIRAAAEDGAA